MRHWRFPALGVYIYRLDFRVSLLLTSGYQPSLIDLSIKRGRASAEAVQQKINLAWVSGRGAAFLARTGQPGHAPFTIKDASSGCRKCHASLDPALLMLYEQSYCFKWQTVSKSMSRERGVLDTKIFIPMLTRATTKMGPCIHHQF